MKLHSEKPDRIGPRELIIIGAVLTISGFGAMFTGISIWIGGALVLAGQAFFIIAGLE